MTRDDKSPHSCWGEHTETPTLVGANIAPTLVGAKPKHLGLCVRDVKIHNHLMCNSAVGPPLDSCGFQTTESWRLKSERAPRGMAETKSFSAQLICKCTSARQLPLHRSRPFPTTAILPRENTRSSQFELRGYSTTESHTRVVIRS